MTSTPPTVLTVVDDAELAASAERIVAAVGARAVRAQAPGRQSWLAAAAVVVDEAVMAFAETGGGVVAVDLETGAVATMELPPDAAATPALVVGETFFWKAEWRIPPT